MIWKRQITEADHEHLAKEIAHDPAHRDWMTTAFFHEPHTANNVFGDDQGPVLYLRAMSVMRLHIQFCDVDKERIRRVLNTQFPLLKLRCKKLGYRQIIFDSVSKGLVLFCRRYLGFRPSRDEYVLWLDPIPTTPATSVNSDLCGSPQK